MVDIWLQLDTHNFESGRNWLVKLAIRILSVIANSAGCERLFSSMGLVHTKTRNRLDLERVRKTVYLKIALQREQEILGWARPRLKRKIDEASATLNTETSRANAVHEAEVSSDSSEVMEDISFEEGLQRLMDQAELDFDESPHKLYVFL
jgi:hypothetical protein